MVVHNVSSINKCSIANAYLYLEKYKINENDDDMKNSILVPVL